MSAYSGKHREKPDAQSKEYPEKELAVIMPDGPEEKGCRRMEDS